MTTMGSGDLRQSLFVDIRLVIKMQPLRNDDMGITERRGSVERCRDRTGFFTRLGVAANDNRVVAPVEMASIREEKDMYPSKSKWWGKDFCDDVGMAVGY